MINPGMPRRISADWLHRQIVGYAGSSLLGLWIGADLVVNAGNVTSWPGRVGGTLAYATGATNFGVTTKNGRQCMTALTGAAKSLELATLPGGVAKSVIAVASHTGVTGDYYTLAKAYTAGAGEALTQLSGTTNWYTAGGWVHRKRGLASEALNTTGTLTIYEGRNASNAGAGMRVGGHTTDSLVGVWPGAIGLVIALSSALDDSTSTALYGALDTYFGTTGS